MDPESIKGKLLVSAIDKIVLGLIAAMILFSIQQCAERAEDKRKRIAAVSQVYTNIIETAVSDIRTQMAEFLVTVESARSVGKLSDKDALNMDGIQMRMRVTLETAVKFGATLEASKKEFLDQTGGLINILLKNNFQEKAINQQRSKVMSAYRDLIDAMKQALVNAIQQEWAK